MVTTGNADQGVAYILSRWLGRFHLLIILPVFLSCVDKRAEGHVFVVGFADEPPYAFVDSAGTVTGESVELARLALSQSGIDSIRWRLAEFGGLITQLETGRIDMIASGMFITPDRARRVSFTIPTLRVYPALLIASSLSDRPASYRALVDSSRLTVAVIHNAAEHLNLRSRGMPDNRLKTYPHVRSAIDALVRGDIESFALSQPSLARIHRNLSHVSTDMSFVVHPLIGEPGDGDTTGFACRKGDSVVVTRLNRSLRQLLGSDAHLELLRRFDFGEENIPSGSRPTDDRRFP